MDLIVDLTGFKGQVVWDGTKTDGQPRRMLNTVRAQEEFDFKAKTGFREGLQKTEDNRVVQGEMRDEGRRKIGDGSGKADGNPPMNSSIRRSG